MLKAGIEMSLLPKPAHASEMGMVYVSIYSKQPLEHCSHYVHKVVREGHPILLWEYARVIHLHAANAAQQSLLAF